MLVRRSKLARLRVFSHPHYPIRWLNTAKNGLDIAFFGSDEFSIESLRKLHEISQSKPEIISKIDVITRSRKPTGRGFKQISDVPIAPFASTLGLNVIRSETDDEFAELLKHKYDFAIAVSYGRLIPKSFIESVPFSLNVHPSLLPRYSGPAPLHHALLNDDEYTGVTVQTLHPTKFDRGKIVAQTQEISIAEEETLLSLRDKLAIAGANLLADVIVDGRYKNSNLKPKYDYSYAGKISSEEKCIRWNSDTHSILRRFNTLGPLYTYKKMVTKKKNLHLQTTKRVIFHELEKVPSTGSEPGVFELKDGKIVVNTKDGAVGSSLLQIACCPKEKPEAFMRQLHKKSASTSDRFQESD